MPEIVLIEGDWKNGDAIDASQRLMGDPEFAFKCRIVILSRNTSQEYLISAAKAGISEVIGKPIDMKALIEQLNKHARKQFVPPPADVEGPSSGGGSFDVSMLMGDSTWALPMLKGLVGPEKINPGFIDEILVQMDEEGIEVQDMFDPSIMAAMLRIALNQLVQDVDPEQIQQTAAETNGDDESKSAPSYDQISKSEKLGSGAAGSTKLKGGMTTMEDILEQQADSIQNEVESIMDEVLDEKPDLVALRPEQELFGVDPDVLKLTRLTNELVYELMWSLGRPGTVEDITLITQIEDITEMVNDVLSSFPTVNAIDGVVDEEE